MVYFLDIYAVKHDINSSVYLNLQRTFLKCKIKWQREGEIFTSCFTKKRVWNIKDKRDGTISLDLRPLPNEHWKNDFLWLPDHKYFHK